MFADQLLQFVDNRHIVFWLGAVMITAPRHTQCFARLTLAHPMFFDHELNQYAPFIRRYSFFATASFKAS